MKAFDITPKNDIQAVWYCRISAERAWLYCRVASDDIYALSAQKQRLESYASEHSWKISGTTAETHHGLNLSRPGLSEVSQAVKDGRVDVFLVSNTSRLCRNTDDLISYWLFLKQHGVRLHTLDEGEIDLSNEIQIRRSCLAAMTANL